MARLKWNAAGTRFFETGVDHGVLYVNGQPGVAWNGLTAVTESPSGADAKSYYIDGVKYLQRAAPEEFAATIEAYTYPDEFAACDGTIIAFSGVLVGQQRRKSFGVSYRTRVGNDISGTDNGYKIHLVYGLLATPSERTYSAIGEEPEPLKFSWQCSSKPVKVGPGFKPAATIVIDSRKIPAQVLQIVEDRLYGSSTEQAYLPSPEEIFELFAANPGGVYDLAINTVTGLSLLVPATPGDLSIVGSTGLFVLTASSHLSGGVDDGIYTWED